MQWARSKIELADYGPEGQFRWVQARTLNRRMDEMVLKELSS